MPQQLLNDLYILAIGFQKRRKCVPKRMPRDHLRDAELSSRRLDVISHDGAQPHGLLSALRSGATCIGSPHVI